MSDTSGATKNETKMDEKRQKFRECYEILNFQIIFLVNLVFKQVTLLYYTVEVVTKNKRSKNGRKDVEKKMVVKF